MANSFNSDAKPNHRYTTKGYTLPNKRRLIALFDNNMCLLLQYSMLLPAGNEVGAPESEIRNSGFSNLKEKEEPNGEGTVYTTQAETETCHFSVETSTESTVVLMRSIYKVQKTKL